VSQNKHPGMSQSGGESRPLVWCGRCGGWAQSRWFRVRVRVFHRAVNHPAFDLSHESVMIDLVETRLDVSAERPIASPVRGHPDRFRLRPQRQLRRPGEQRLVRPSPPSSTTLPPPSGSRSRSRPCCCRREPSPSPKPCSNVPSHPERSAPRNSCPTSGRVSDSWAATVSLFGASICWPDRIRSDDSLAIFCSGAASCGAVPAVDVTLVRSYCSVHAVAVARARRTHDHRHDTRADSMHGVADRTDRRAKHHRDPPTHMVSQGNRNGRLRRLLHSHLNPRPSRTGTVALSRSGTRANRDRSPLG